MDAHQKHVSLLFYKYICDVIGTQEVVAKRRQIFRTVDSVMNLRSKDKFSQISTGSRAEGLDLPGSDFDIMYINNTYTVCENLNQLDHGHPPKINLLMETNDKQPGFTKLKVVGYWTDRIVEKCCVDVRENRYFSSTLFKKFIKGTSDKNSASTINGPSINVNDEVDFAHCLHSKHWLSQAHNYIQRTKYSWASKSFLETILQFGVAFVPIGSKLSSDIHDPLQWRMSFAFAEKLLVWSFNHSQLLCYALLKILLKEVIPKKVPETSVKRLCSYYLKTIMLWLCEEIDSSHWKPESLLSLYIIALQRLTYCVEKKTLSHYFIQDSNLFKNRFSKEEYDDLRLTLNDLLKFGWTHLLGAETLKSFQYVCEHSLQSETLTVSYMPFLPLPLIEKIDTRRKENLEDSIYFCVRAMKKSFHIYYFSYINQMVAQRIGLLNGEYDNNKDKYKQYRKQRCHLLMGLNHDAVSGWLLLASFFASNKQYLYCQFLVNWCLSTFIYGNFLASSESGILEDHHLFNKLRRQLPPSDHSDLLSCKYFTTMPIIWTGPNAIFPDSFRPVLKKPHPVHISPLVFSHYLRFLCEDNAAKRRDILDEMMNAASTPSTTDEDQGNEFCWKIAYKLLNKLECVMRISFI